MLSGRSPTIDSVEKHLVDLKRRLPGTFVYTKNVPKLPPAKNLEEIFKKWPAPRPDVYELDCLTDSYYDQNDNKTDVHVKGSVLRKISPKVPMGKPIKWRLGSITADGNCYFHAITALLYGSRNDGTWVIIKAQHLKFFQEVKKNPEHPRHKAYLSMDKNSQNKYSNRLKEWGAWQLSNLAVITADLYGLYIVMMEHPKGADGELDLKQPPFISFVAGSPNGRHVVLLFIGNHYELLIPSDTLYAEWQMRKIPNTDKLRLQAYGDVDRELLNKSALQPILPPPSVELPEIKWLELAWGKDILESVPDAPSDVDDRNSAAQRRMDQTRRLEAAQISPIFKPMPQIVEPVQTKTPKASGPGASSGPIMLDDSDDDEPVVVIPDPKKTTPTPEKAQPPITPQSQQAPRTPKNSTKNQMRVTESWTPSTATEKATTIGLNENEIVTVQEYNSARNGVKRYFPKDRLAPFASSSTSPPKFGVTPTPQTSAAKTMASRPIPGSSSSKGPISIGKYEITDRFVKPGAQSDWTAQLKKGDIVSVTRHGPNGYSDVFRLRREVVTFPTSRLKLVQAAESGFQAKPTPTTPPRTPSPGKGLQPPSRPSTSSRTFPDARIGMSSGASSTDTPQALTINLSCPTTPKGLQPPLRSTFLTTTTPPTSQNPSTGGPQTPSGRKITTPSRVTRATTAAGSGNGNGTGGGRPFGSMFSYRDDTPTAAGTTAGPSASSSKGKKRTADTQDDISTEQPTSQKRKGRNGAPVAVVDLVGDDDDDDGDVDMDEEIKKWLGE